MQANGFDGNAAFSGGGFMPSQATQSVPARPSTSSSSKNSDTRCLIPLTVKQLNDLSRGGESDISIDGVDVNNILLVGMVSKIDNAVSDCTFRIDDGTGWVECTKWIHERVDSAEVDVISVGMYVRVCGQLKCIQSRTLHIFSIRKERCIPYLDVCARTRPVTDFNEITNHFIECIYVHLFNTKLRGGMTTLAGITNSIGSTSTTAQPQVANSILGNPIKGYGYQTNLTSQYHNNEQISVVSSRVLQLLRRPACLGSETGISSEDMARELNVSYDKIRKSLDLLLLEGLVYRTSDDHYKFTDA